jgi:hypothetical protein
MAPGAQSRPWQLQWLRNCVLIAALVHSALTASLASAAPPARIAVFDLELVDSSLQGEMAGVDPADRARLRLVQEELEKRLRESGRFELVETAPVADRVAAAGRLWSCNGCEVPIARHLDADLALVGWVQKVSNLILNLNVVIRDTDTREQVFASSVDIRGNTDESWLHGIRYLLDRRLLRD